MARKLPLAQVVRYGFLIVAVGVAASFFFFSNARYDDAVTFDGVDLSALGEGLRLTNPRFTGATAKGEPFTVTAEWALPDGPRPENVELSKVSGELNLIDGRFVELSALSGLLQPRANVIELAGSVAFIASDGHELRAASARLDADESRLTAGGPIKVSGTMGRIEAGSLRVERRGEDGDFIWFENRVKVFIDAPNQTAAE